ncbi:MAG TPA: transcription-repair coupling factor [Zeimonas sp.]|nr:transcription-repair coupling factor [Zeimonas sp.]
MRALPRCHGSGDALLLAALAERERARAPRAADSRPASGEGATAHGRALAIITARPGDAVRLVQELRWFAPRLRVLLLPDWETLPYDAFSPHQDLVSERLSTLYALQQHDCDVVLAPITTALQRLAPARFLASHTFFFHKGQRLDEARLRSQLAFAGYENVTQVVRPGEYAVRGGLIDLFPMGSNLPYRIDLFGDEIDSIRTFDPDTQRSLYPIDRVRLLPGREFSLDEASRTAFRGRWRERFEGDPSASTIYRDVGNGIAPPGIEYWLPLFHERTATLFDYLPDDAIVVSHGDVDAAARRFAQEATERYRFLSHDRSRPLLEPAELFLDSETLFAQAKGFGRWSIAAPGEDADGTAASQGEAKRSGRERFAGPPPEVAIDRRAPDPVERTRAWLDTPGTRKLIVAESPGRRETLEQLFAENGLRLPAVEDWKRFVDGDLDAAIVVGPIFDGFDAPAIGLSVVTETELFAASPRRRRRGLRETQTDVDSIIRDLSELKEGDPVVHAQHGIGRYQGLVTMELDGEPTEFLHLRYAKDATLYVPVAQLHVISRYSGAAPENAPLHELGSGQWEKARRRAASKARDAAAELLNLYARRAAREGHAFGFQASQYEAFAEGFPFDETPDQQAAIDAVVGDMVSGKPMDRLVCGDVGFGKTEVALRAAWVAVADGKQVAVLAPTTLLAEQHFRTFSDRFAELPVRIAQLSRFRSKKETGEAIEGLKSGDVDIAIGTHKLLSPDVRFARLGLVIIDEEHRFGVRQKEALKALRAEVDVLTLTATPIPRTLAMSLEGIRDFSVIATAPQRRLAIKTFVRRESSGTIREALMRELKRGGQAYFLHNEVETIENRRARLAELVPEARIGVAHGQMPERELERVMRDFLQQRYNVLLCTTIIETGIDVPSANTIVIHRADRFGLAQLHQLRGRVGRSHHQAYAYLLVPDEKSMTRDAVKRLEAIQALEELGSGFYLAMHDLEIRGAGEVLGEAQSGDIQEVGFALYSEMLAEAVDALRAGREPDLSAPLAATTEIVLRAPALLPEDYVPDVHERLSLYKRMANGTSFEALDALREELVDRFGKLPDAARTLLETHRLRIASRPLGIAKIDAAADTIVVQFVPDPPLDAAALIRFIQSRRDVRLAGPDRLRFTIATPDLAARIQQVRAIVDALGKLAPDAKNDVSRGRVAVAPAGPAPSRHGPAGSAGRADRGKAQRRAHR